MTHRAERPPVSTDTGKEIGKEIDEDIDEDIDKDTGTPHLIAIDHEYQRRWGQKHLISHLVSGCSRSPSLGLSKGGM